MKKNKKQKNKLKATQYKNKYVVKYDDDKFIVMILTIVLIIPSIISIFYNDYAIIAAFFCINFPMIIFTFFTFRFCVKYDARKRKIKYRYFFKFKSIDFDDIQRIYIKSETGSFFLVIKSKNKKVRMNTLSCTGTKELQVALKKQFPTKCEF